MKFWLDRLASENMTQVTLALVVLLVVVTVLYLAAHISRRSKNKNASSKETPSETRLSISSVLPLDQSRQLILLKRDNVEHLLLVGGSPDIVVENNIMSEEGTFKERAPAWAKKSAPVFKNQKQSKTLSNKGFRPYSGPIPLDTTSSDSANIGEQYSSPLDSGDASLNRNQSSSRNSQSQNGNNDYDDEFAKLFDIDTDDATKHK